MHPPIFPPLRPGQALHRSQNDGAADYSDYESFGNYILNCLNTRGSA